MSKATQVILVDKNDNPIGTAEKLLAHQKNLCHRAFSVILTREINNNIEILLQKRQKTKYHCANLWSNTCCSHPKPGENTLESAKKRLLFEMGITCKINYIGAIYYQTKLANQLFEHEYDQRHTKFVMSEQRRYTQYREDIGYRDFRLRGCATNRPRSTT